jgi:hypothetical protein
VNAFVALKSVNLDVEQTRKELILQVRKSIGPFAAPKAVYVVDDLPKTRSGKIMRRILRKILSGEEDSLGDISTVSWLNPDDCFVGIPSSDRLFLRHSCRTQVLSARLSTPITPRKNKPVKSLEVEKRDLTIVLRP